MTIIRTENPFPNIQPPAGAVEVCEWDDRPPPRTSRPGTSSGRAAASAASTSCSTAPSTPTAALSGARKIAAALIEAADEIAALT
jgi:hypothetical protein